jgi:hypothetical protein
MINYQGRLTDDAGAAVADGPYLIKFKIYGSETGDDSLWYSGYQTVTVTGGLFSYQLGTSPSFPHDLFEGDTTRYLGITVGVDPEITPRTRLITVPYAYQALRADSTQYAANAASVPPGSIGATEINSGEVQVRIANSCPSGCYISGIDENGTVACAEDSVGSSNWSVTDSVLYTNNFWGIARGGADNAVLGAGYTAVNLGVACTTGTQSYATIGGGWNNVVNSSYSTIGGGFRNRAGIAGVASWCTGPGGNNNTANGDESTVGGGYSNVASAEKSVVSGGSNNEASGEESTVSGGDNNIASGYRSTISGGYDNTASGSYSTVVGGDNNSAGASFSFVAGQRAIADPTATGSFVWADANDKDWTCGTANFFTARCTGGAMFTTAIDGSGLPVAGVSVGPGGNAWSSVSDRNRKENFESVDTHEILEKVAALPITSWNYKSEDQSIRHIGPMAQDFYPAFGLEEDNKRISTIDPDGVALAAIQALVEEIQQLKQRIGELEAQNK